MNIFLSGYRLIKWGVPQEFIHGPLVFVLYVNDLSDQRRFVNVSCLQTIPFFYTVLFCSMTVLLLLVYKNLFCWLNKKNDLNLNVKKSKLMWSGNENSESNALETEILANCQNVKYLDVIIDDGFTLKRHVSNVFNKISSLRLSLCQFLKNTKMLRIIIFKVFRYR